VDERVLVAYIRGRFGVSYLCEPVEHVYALGKPLIFRPTIFCSLIFHKPLAFSYFIVAGKDSCNQ
jgi:hypothetical protein